MPNRFVPKVTHQPTDEARYACLWSELKSIHLLLEKISWVNVFIKCDQARRFRFDDLNFIPPDNVLRPRPDTDKRIARDPFPAFDRFEQERGTGPAQFHIHADGCLEVRGDVADNRRLSCRLRFE